MSSGVYFGEWNNGREHPLIDDHGYYSGFEVSNSQAIEIAKLDIICAAYDREQFDGSAFVLFRKDGKLYEVNDAHCSCYGLRDWSPEETTKEALLMRDERYGAFGAYAKEIKEIIKSLED